MPTQDDDRQQHFALGIIFVLAALIVAAVLGMGMNNRIFESKPAGVVVSQTPSGTGAVSNAPGMVSVPSDSNGNMDAASIQIEQDLVKFYFASGKSNLAPGAALALADMVKAAAAGRQLVVSGFHDASGDTATNAALARQRARAVQTALKNAGVPEERITLKKLEEMTGSGSDAEARRVEISLQ